MKLAVLSNHKNVGKLHGEGDAFSSGVVKHFDFTDIAGLHKLILATAKKPKLCVSVGTYPKNGKVLPKDKATLGEMTRTKDVVNKGSILVIDNDLGTKLDLKMLSKHWDIFKKAGYVQTKSGSTLSGKKKHGTHTYYVVENGIARLKSSMEFLEDICIVEGAYKVEHYATGKAVIKTPIDLALNQNSRIVYEDDTKPLLHEGENISLMDLPKNHKKITKEANKIRAKALKKAQPKELKLHAKYVKKTTGKKLKNKKAIKHSIANYNNYTIDENFPLYSGGYLLGTVGDLLTGKLDEVLFSDLYEPEYGGGSQKAKYYQDTQTFISQAHGGIKYTVEVSAKFNDTMIAEFLKEVPHLEDGYNIDPAFEKIIGARDLVDKGRLIKDYAKENGVTGTIITKEIERLTKIKGEFDKFYALWLKGEYESTINPNERLKNFIDYKKDAHLVNVGGKNVIFRLYKDDEGNILTSVNQLEVETVTYSDRKSTIMETNKNSGETKFTDVDTPKMFVNGNTNDDSGAIEPCKRYQGIDFAPKKDLQVAYNLFNGFSVEPTKGDIKTWKKSMSKAFGKDHYNFIMDWFADMYQNPDRKCTFAVIVKGKKGTGKTTFEDILGRRLLSGENYFRTANKEQLFGKFNKQLASNLLTVGQEIVWGGDHHHDSILKDMITENSRVIELKGVDNFSVNNFSRIYMTSNSEWVVPASSDERRFYVASTQPEARKIDWKALYEWCDIQSNIEALMYEMMNRDLSNFNNKSCPITKELSSQKYESLTGVAKFVAQGLENEYFGRDGGFDTIEYVGGSKVTLRDLYRSYSDSSKYPTTMNKFSRELTSLGIVDERVTLKKHKAILLKSKEEATLGFKVATGAELDVAIDNMTFNEKEYILEQIEHLEGLLRLL